MERIYFNNGAGISGKLYTLNDLKKLFAKDNYFCDTFEEYLERILNEDVTTFRWFYTEHSLWLLEEIDDCINEDNDEPDIGTARLCLEEWHLLRRLSCVNSNSSEYYSDEVAQELVDKYNFEYL